MAVPRLTSVPDRKIPDALVLVENEVTVGGEYDFWADDTGVRYHFPNQYRNRVRPGLPFVYYRGVRRAARERGVAEYFGTGTIGEVWPDPAQPPDTPARNRRWFCAVEDYQPFPTPIPAKRGEVFYEQITTPLAWRTGVREITSDILDRILSAARSEPSAPQLKRVEVADATVVQSQPQDMLVSRPRSASASSHSSRQPSRELKKIGDWAEELVYRWLADILEPSERDSLDWVAQRGETPGWDIAYRAATGSEIHVEVKGTTLARFAGIDLTTNEWAAATHDAQNYVLALVTRAQSAKPNVALMWNPARHVAKSSLEIHPTGFRLVARVDA